MCAGVCKEWSVKPNKLRRFKYFNQQDATVSQVYYLKFMRGSKSFGCLPAHHQELTTALEASGFTVVGRGLAGYNLPDHDQQRFSRFSPTVKPEAPSAVVCS
jgi:hypothetical protein